MTVTNPLINSAKKIFVDTVRIKVKGGRGGTGLPMYGGTGGPGGDVIIQGRKNVMLNLVAKRNPGGLFVAGDGKPSYKHKLVGEKGNDLKIQVPIGVTIEDDNKQFVAEINHPNESVIVAMGGRGGDKFNDNHGHVGQSRVITLNLKIISDVGFVGFPNAGKSTLLRAISKATPRVAAFPFTTLRPYLGVVEYDDLRQIVFTDLPGLVEGAHKNIGLGHDFLRHVERCRILCFMVDISTVNGKSPIETISILNYEIEKYNDVILEKPAILLLTKADLMPSSDVYSIVRSIETQVKELAKQQKMVQFEKVLPISSTTKFNIDQIKTIARDLIDANAEL